METAAVGQQWHLDRSALETGCSGWECGVVEALGEPTVAAAAIGIGLAVFLTFALLREAADAIAEEREHVLRERNAFRAFADRIEGLQPESSAKRGTAGDATGAAAVRVTAETSGANGGLNTVEAAYRQTVMAMRHYETEYGESMEENMAVELGSDVATAVVAGDQLTPGLQSALVSEGRRAAKRRQTLLTQLDGEAKRIEEARRVLKPVERRIDDIDEDLVASNGFPDGESAWNRLDAIESELETELRRQQERLDPTEHPAGEPHVFCQYLYGSDASHTDASSYPVLKTLGQLLQRVEQCRSRALEAVTNATTSR